MANEIKMKTGTSAAITITLSSLTNGSGRQGTFIDNSTNLYHGAIVWVKMRSSGSAPTAGTTYDVYLLRRDSHSSPALTTDAAGSSDAALTVENAKLLGSLVLTATTTKDFVGEFDTGPLGPLGASWTVAVVNRSGQTTDSTAGNHVVQYLPYLPEVQ